MTTIIKLLMYSGKQDPSWELSEEQASKLKDILSKKRETSFITPSLSTGILGYRGFVIESFDPALPSKAFSHDGIIHIPDQSHLNFIDKDSDLESFLLKTAGTSITEDEKRYVTGEISKNSKGGPGSLNKFLRTNFEPLTVPPYDPGKWNIPSVQPYNNCYNYANDKITNTFAQPGRGSGSTITDITCGVVGPAAQRDGQIPVSSAASTPTEGQYIALVSANLPTFKDYHWYRLDSNGLWSHKPGSTQARNTDNSGRTISDPRNCDRGPYTDFCGFFHCIPSKTTIR